MFPARKLCPSEQAVPVAGEFHSVSIRPLQALQQAKPGEGMNHTVRIRHTVFVLRGLQAQIVQLAAGIRAVRRPAEGNLCAAFGAVEYIALSVDKQMLRQRGAPLRAEGAVLLRALGVVGARERQPALARADPVQIRRLYQEVARVEVDRLQPVGAKIAEGMLSRHSAPPQ